MLFIFKEYLRRLKDLFISMISQIMHYSKNVLVVTIYIYPISNLTCPRMEHICHLKLFGFRFFLVLFCFFFLWNLQETRYCIPSWYPLLFLSLDPWTKNIQPGYGVRTSQKTVHGHSQNTHELKNTVFSYTG